MSVIFDSRRVTATYVVTSGVSGADLLIGQSGAPFSPRTVQGTWIKGQESEAWKLDHLYAKGPVILRRGEIGSINVSEYWDGSNEINTYAPQWVVRWAEDNQPGDAI
jgi:hypothetical protein